MEAKRLALLCRELADNKKAEQIVVLDVRKLSSVTDYFVICSGTSDPHLRAIVGELEDRLREDHGIKARAQDGADGGRWVVMDFFDVIVHVMHPEVRELYDLEGLWSDAKPVRSLARRKNPAA
ncbi:MAG: ribosome silencing factor [Verrucomicrobia bacterium]|nr:ribosome silencing factor [Verrucomicrobiota bacterium]MBM3870380.1 ribosome silencing factor [Verrucomicrobiota bacterium]